MDKQTSKILNSYARLSHINKKWVIKAFENIPKQNQEFYLFSIKASIKLMEQARKDPQSVQDKKKFISDFIKKEKQLKRKLPDFKNIKLKVKPPKPQRFVTDSVKGQVEYDIPKEWKTITKLLLNGKRVDFSVKELVGKSVIVLDHKPQKNGHFTCFVILNT